MSAGEFEIELELITTCKTAGCVKIVDEAKVTGGRSGATAVMQLAPDSTYPGDKPLLRCDREATLRSEAGPVLL